jgi:hypothetical protein
MPCCLCVSLRLCLRNNGVVPKRKGRPSELNTAVFPDVLIDCNANAPLQYTLVMQHAPHSNRLCKCLPPISIECLASRFIFTSTDSSALFFRHPLLPQQLHSSESWMWPHNATQCHWKPCIATHNWVAFYGVCGITRRHDDNLLGCDAVYFVWVVLG